MPPFHPQLPPKVAAPGTLYVANDSAPVGLDACEFVSPTTVAPPAQIYAGDGPLLHERDVGYVPFNGVPDVPSVRPVNDVFPPERVMPVQQNLKSVEVVSTAFPQPTAG